MYAFQQTDGTLPPVTIRGGFDSRAAAHCYAMAWFDKFGFTMVCGEPDNAEDGFDFAMQRRGTLSLFAINRIGG